jgi:hypothetical protein
LRKLVDLLVSPPTVTLVSIKKGYPKALAQQRRPVQRESYPELNLVAVKSAMDHLDAAVCIFERRNQVVGQVFAPEVGEKHIDIHYLFSYDLQKSVEAEVSLKTITQKNPLDQLRRVFSCPLCDLNRWSLYYVDQWACASCHGLFHRSQLVDKEVTLAEKRDQLRALAKHGRPKGMHNRTYAQLRLELAELERRLQGRARKYASDEQDAVVTARWVAGGEIDLWSTKYVVSQGSFVRTG